MLSTMSGSTFMSIDTRSKVPLKGGKKNPMQGRVEKFTSSSLVQVFQNKKVSGYGNMVRRRLADEGKDPADYVPQPRKWGTRVPEMPIIEHTKDDITKHYLEVIFLTPGKSEYFLDGGQIDKDKIEGLEAGAIRDDAQGGLENLVIIRTYDLASIDYIRYQGKVWRGPFFYEDKE
jgi:hypothetical protein